MTELTNDLPAGSRFVTPTNYWQETFKVIDETIAEARCNPDTARSLFALASCGRRDPELLEKLRMTFDSLKISLEFLSNYESD